MYGLRGVHCTYGTHTFNSFRNKQVSGSSVANTHNATVRSDPTQRADGCRRNARTDAGARCGRTPALGADAQPRGAEADADAVRGRTRTQCGGGHPPRPHHERLRIEAPGRTFRTVTTAGRSESPSCPDRERAPRVERMPGPTEGRRAQITGQWRLIRTDASARLGQTSALGADRQKRSVGTDASARSGRRTALGRDGGQRSVGTDACACRRGRSVAVFRHTLPLVHAQIWLAHGDMRLSYGRSVYESKAQASAVFTPDRCNRQPALLLSQAHARSRTGHCQVGADR